MLGAAALAGYVGGGMGAQALERRVGTRAALALGMAAALVSLLACALPGGVAWLLPWRLLAGLAGGALLGGARAARLWLWVQVAALLPWWPALILAAALGGFAVVGISAATLAWAREAAGGLWVRAAITYALAQAGAAFALAAVFGASGESHLVVFGLGLSVLAVLAALRAPGTPDGSCPPLAG